MANEELWKEILEVEGYAISNLGRVKSLERYIISNGRKVFFKSKILKPYISNAGYLGVVLWSNGRSRYFHIHRLVAKYFLDNPNCYKCINHIDENKLNNRYDNLEWCDIKYNNIYSSYRAKYNCYPIAVDKLDKNGVVLESYKTIKEASLKNNIDRRGISFCIEGRQKTAGGYCWRKADIKRKESCSYENIKIEQYDKSGSLINVFSSLSEASNVSGVEKRLIGYVLKDANRHTAGGFVWKIG